jgi:hypothetical protein
MYRLHRFLVDYDMAMLRALAQKRGATLSTNRQVEAVNQLATALLDPLSVRTALAQLGQEGLEALETLLANGGRMRAPQFGRRFGQIRPTGPGRLERDASWQDPANPAEELWYAGLIFRAFHDDKGGPGEFIFVPDDLRPLLPQPQIDPPAFTLTSVPSPAQPADHGQALVHDMFAYLAYLQNHDVRPYADGRLGQRDLAALRESLVDNGGRRLVFLRHLAEQMGFASRQDEHLRLEAAAVKRWLTAAPARQLAALQGAWRDDRVWNDLCHVPALVCDQETTWRNEPLATRQAILALLARCPLDEWWPLASFIAAVKETHPDFQRPDGDYTNWYIRDAASGTYLSGFESWDQVEGAFITDLLAGPLHWLGIVAISADENGPICCLTDPGARLLGLAEDEAESLPPPPIIVYPDFRVEVPAPVNLYVRFQLERFADPMGPSVNIAEPCIYRLTVAGLGRALARAIRIEQVQAFLQQASEGSVPANVTGQLQMWAGRFGQAQLEEIALLRLKSERAMKEISVLPETRSLIGQVLSPTSALVRKQDIPRLRNALRALGYLAEPAGGEPPEHG